MLAMDAVSAAIRPSLRTKNKIVGNTLGQELSQYLESMSDWFKYLDDYRHALEHRIPLYVPPFAIDPRNADRYSKLERSIVALIVQRNGAETQAPGSTT